VIGLGTLLKLIYYIFSNQLNLIFNLINTTTLVIFVLGILINFFILTKVYITTFNEKNEISTLIKTIWITLFISLAPLGTASFIPMILLGNHFIDPLYTGWFVIFFPLSFAYLIATKQIFDIQLVLRRLIVTIFIVAIPSLLIVATDIMIFKNAVTVLDVVIDYFLTLSILTVVLYSLEYITTKFEKVMFPRKHYLRRALKKISKNLSKINSFRELKEIILTDIVNTLEVHGGAIVFDFKNNIETIIEGDIDKQEVERIVHTRSFDASPFTCLDIHTHEEYTCYLILTRKKTNTVLGLEEVQWINLIISYLAVCLENIYLIRKLTSRVQTLASNMPDSTENDEFLFFRKMMFEIQEKERRRMAMDLHDTTMQDLFFLKRKLAGLMEKYVLTSEDRLHMSSLTDYIEIVNTNLRENCFELNPYLLTEIGLVETVRKVVAREEVTSPFEIEYQSFGKQFIESMDTDKKLHLFRIVQELINNAKKHSQASLLKINLSGDWEQIVLTYEDNGVGFDPDREAIREIGGSGVGLEQMKSRILYLLGSWELKTSPGKGMKLFIKLPLEGTLSA
jgi:two-component system sensor histidine kinase ComP